MYTSSAVKKLVLPAPRSMAILLLKNYTDVVKASQQTNKHRFNRLNVFVNIQSRAFDIMQKFLANVDGHTIDIFDLPLKPSDNTVSPGIEMSKN